MHRGSSDENLTAQQGDSLYRALVLDIKAEASAQDDMFSNRFRNGDQIDVLQCIDDTKGMIRLFLFILHMQRE